MVRRRGHIHAGITGGYFVFETLLEAERHDLIYPMATATDYPGWGYMLRRGATTLWESWDRRNSLLHSSYLSIGPWFTEGLGGIRPGKDGHGYQDFVISPGFEAASDLTWVTAGYDSLYGQIVSEWRRSGASIELSVTVPPNTRATLFVPVTDPRRIRESGRPLGEAAGAAWVKADGNRGVLRLESGSYRLTCHGVHQE